MLVGRDRLVDLTLGFVDRTLGLRRRVGLAGELQENSCYQPAKQQRPAADQQALDHKLSRSRLIQVDGPMQLAVVQRP